MRYSDGQKIIIEFEDQVLDLFDSHRQLKNQDMEAGGQLFAQYSEDALVVSKATGLRQGDKRERFLFCPNRTLERKEIKELFAKGLHYVGDWHTHPQRTPKPSNTDIKSVHECYRKSTHSLKHFVMVIVGTAQFPEGMNVSLHNGQESIFLPNTDN